MNLTLFEQGVERVYEEGRNRLRNDNIETS